MLDGITAVVTLRHFTTNELFRHAFDSRLSMKISSVFIIAFCAYCMAGCAFGQTVTGVFYNDTSCSVIGNPLAPSIPNPNTFNINTCTKVLPATPPKFPADIYAVGNCSQVSGVWEVHLYLFADPSCSTFVGHAYNTSGLCNLEKDASMSWKSSKMSCSQATPATAAPATTATPYATTAAKPSSNSSTPATSTANTLSLSFLALIFVSVFLFF
jgi:hypothetical protein